MYKGFAFIKVTGIVIEYLLVIILGIEEDFRAWRKIFWRKAGPILTGRKTLTPATTSKKGKKCEGKCKSKEGGGKCSSDEENEEEGEVSGMKDLIN